MSENIKLHRIESITIDPLSNTAQFEGVMSGNTPITIQVAAKDFMWQVTKAYEEKNKLLPRLKQQRDMIEEFLKPNAMALQSWDVKLLLTDKEQRVILNLDRYQPTETTIILCIDDAKEISDQLSEKVGMIRG